jgi:UDP-N-acetylglucosamine--N-acetylmuramyl-(pentapeptide) pyrophosphoryl-undecaprenol N-acetylglucosamine transferase
MEPKEKRIIFATGGSGGHIFPAISVYQHLKKINPAIDVLFIVSGRPQDLSILKMYKCEKCETLPMKPLPARVSLVKALDFISSFLKSLIKSFKILECYKPDLVVAFGAYVSVPVGIVAFFKKKDVILHEQNIIPSKTNLFLKRFAKLILLGFKDSRKFFPKVKTLTIGNPLRKDLKLLAREEAASRFNTRLGTKSRIGNESFNIFIMGGSQGAKILNEVVPKAVSLLDKKKRQKISIVHLAGSYSRDIQQFYAQAQIKAKVLDFLKEIELAFSLSDLAITRSGALTLSELAFFGIPAILIPYAYDKGFQSENAKYYTKNGAAFLLEEKSFSPQTLKNLIEKLMENSELLFSMKRKMLSLRRISAAEKFSDIILNWKCQLQ